MKKRFTVTLMALALLVFACSIYKFLRTEDYVFLVLMTAQCFFSMIGLTLSFRSREPLFVQRHPAMFGGLMLLIGFGFIAAIVAVM